MGIYLPANWRWLLLIHDGEFPGGRRRREKRTKFAKKGSRKVSNPRPQSIEIEIMPIGQPCWFD